VLAGADSPLRGVGAPLASPSLGQLYQLRPGGVGLPGRWVGPLYPALALVAVLFAPAARRRQACWLLGVLLLAGLLAAWQGSALPGRFTAWPGGVLVPGAVAWAAAVGLGFGGLGTALRRRGHLGSAAGRGRAGVQQLAAWAVALLVVAGGVLVLAQLGRGAWAPLRPVTEPALPARVPANGTRVLWLAGRADGGVDYAVTGPGGRTFLDPGRRLAPAAAAALRPVVIDLLEARTHRAGTQLETFGIGYVAIRPGPGADRLSDLVGRQQDLQLQPSRQAAVFEADDQVPGGWWVQGGAPASQSALIAGKGPIPLPAGSRGVTGPATVVVPVPADAGWRASVGGVQLPAARPALGWAQAFTVPAGVGGRVLVEHTGQQRRDVLLLVEGLLLVTALATMARPTRVAPPPPPSSLADTTGDLRLTLAQGRAR
jgi:hypothetical protein